MDIKELAKKVTKMPEGELRDMRRALEAVDPENRDDKDSQRRKAMRIIDQELRQRTKSD